MKDEIKLKDMTDFLENVYKNIKKQPTIEEELDKERKFINKIKGDNKDEIKEILDYISDRVIEKEKWNKIKDYITNLQEENERLQNIIDKSIKYASETRDILDCYHNGEWIDMVDILYGNEIEDDD